MASTIAATSAELIDRHERLERSEASYRALFESNPWPLWVCDPATLQIIAVNDTAVERYGYDRETLLSIRLGDLGPLEHAETLRTCAGPASRGAMAPARWTLRTRHQLRSGRVVDVDLTTQAIEYGGRPACLAVAVDVTEQVDADRALRVSEAAAAVDLYLRRTWHLRARSRWRHARHQSCVPSSCSGTRAPSCNCNP